jgi:putative ABC transport system substrate-binding protein
MLKTLRLSGAKLSLLLHCVLLAFPIFSLAENLEVLVISNDNNPMYQSFIKSLESGLPAGVRSKVLHYQDQIPNDPPRADLIVAIGVKASELATAQAGIPVLAVMIPEMTYESLINQGSRKQIGYSISAIYIDQPMGRQIDFWRAVLPERRRIGLVHTSDARIDIAALRDGIAHRGGSLIEGPVHSEDSLFPALQGVLESSDLLVAIPDSKIYNSSYIRNILLTSYRAGVPLIGLSQSYVDAGALCAIFSTPEQLAEQTSATIISFARTRHLPSPQFPVAFTVAVNAQVAQSMGINLPSIDVIRDRMEGSQWGGQ